MKEESKELEIQKETKLVVVDDSEFSMYLDTAKFDHLWRVATVFSRSDLVPEHYRGKPENCMISISMAVRVGVDPMMMLQNSYVVHGNPGIEAKLAIAIVNTSGTFTGKIQYKYSGEGMKRACTAYATSKSNGELCEQTVTLDMAKAEGWYDKKGSKWKTLPDLMLAYRSAMFLSRLYCPECLMGMMTVEELKDVGKKNINEVSGSRSESIKDRFAKKEEESTDANVEETKEPEQGEFESKLAEIADDPEYKNVIQTLLKSEAFLPVSLRSTDENTAKAVYEKIIETKGFEEDEIKSISEENESSHFKGETMKDKMLITTEQVNPLEIFVDGKYLELLEFIKKKSAINKPDASTGKGRAVIRSMAAQVASSKVFVVKAGKVLADAEKKKIEEKLTAINSSKKFIEDSLVYLKEEVREPLTIYEEEEKAVKAAEFAKQEKERDYIEALEHNAFLDEKNAVAEDKKRIEEEKIQLKANQEAVKNFGSVSQVAVNDAIKNQGAAEAETKRLKQKVIDDEKQAEIAKNAAVETERKRVQAEADEKERKRIEVERIKCEVEEAKAADVTHRKSVNNKALSGLVEILMRQEGNFHAEEIGKQIIIAIIEGKITNVSIKY